MFHLEHHLPATATRTDGHPCELAIQSSGSDAYSLDSKVGIARVGIKQRSTLGTQARREGTIFLIITSDDASVRQPHCRTHTEIAVRGIAPPCSGLRFLEQFMLRFAQFRLVFAYNMHLIYYFFHADLSILVIPTAKVTDFFRKFALRTTKINTFMIQNTLRTIIIATLWSTASTIMAQTKSQAFIDYIEKYKSIAIEQMELHKIPASITLAQGLLESGAGSSELAKKSNNHFGIKCGSTWFGPTYTHFDDGRNECFRVYANVRESYDDHSQFLQKERYSRLFRLSTTDYKGWAHGLKACGYATSPTYADRLIGIIELYELNKLDRDPNAPVVIPEPQPVYETVELRAHRLLTNNNVMCIRATNSDTWDSLAQEFSISKKHLLAWNEAIESVDINEGDLIYLQKKQKKAAKQYGKDYWHHVRQGESMYSIAQLYGIRLKNLYRLNFRPADYAPQAGDLLKVR